MFSGISPGTPRGRLAIIRIRIRFGDGHGPAWGTQNRAADTAGVVWNRYGDGLGPVWGPLNRTQTTTSGGWRIAVDIPGPARPQKRSKNIRPDCLLVPSCFRVCVLWVVWCTKSGQLQGPSRKRSANPEVSDANRVPQVIQNSIGMITKVFGQTHILASVPHRCCTLEGFLRVR